MLLNDLADVLRAGGSVVEETPGWIGWNHGPMTQVDCIVIHHTATPESYPGDYPSLNVMRNGRSDLAGPLAQLGGGRSGKLYVVSNGLCWHAGATLETWMDNYHSIGIECESSGDGTVWPDAQVQGVARAVASLCRRYNVPSSRVLGHKEVCYPVGRKIDPIGIPGGMPAFRALVQQYINNPNFNTGGFLMALSDQEQRDLYNRIFGFLKQRWFKPGVDGNPVEVTGDTKDAIPAHALDSLDGNYLVQRAQAAEAQAKAALDAVTALAAKVDTLLARSQA